MAHIFRGMFVSADGGNTLGTSFLGHVVTGDRGMASNLPAGQHFSVRSVVFRLNTATGVDYDGQILFYLALGASSNSVTPVYSAVINPQDKASARCDFNPPLAICIDSKVAGDWEAARGGEVANTMYVFARTELDIYDALRTEVHWEQPAY